MAAEAVCLGRCVCGGATRMAGGGLPKKLLHAEECGYRLHTGQARGFSVSANINCGDVPTVPGSGGVQAGGQEG